MDQRRPRRSGRGMHRAGREEAAGEPGRRARALKDATSRSSEPCVTLRQDVLEEAAHELMAGDAGGPPSVRFAVLVTNDDSLVVEADDTRIGDGTRKTIAREIFDTACSPFSPDRAMDDPWSATRRPRAKPGRTGASTRPWLAAEEFGQGLAGRGRRCATDANGRRHRRCHLR